MLSQNTSCEQCRMYICNVSEPTNKRHNVLCSKCCYLFFFGTSTTVYCSRRQIYGQHLAQHNDGLSSASGHSLLIPILLRHPLQQHCRGVSSTTSSSRSEPSCTSQTYQRHVSAEN